MVIYSILLIYTYYSILAKNVNSSNFYKLDIPSKLNYLTYYKSLSLNSKCKTYNYCNYFKFYIISNKFIFSIELSLRSTCNIFNCLEFNKVIF